MDKFKVWEITDANDGIAEFADTFKLLGVCNKVHVTLVVGISRTEDVGNFATGDVVHVVDDPAADEGRVIHFGRLEVRQVLS